MVVQYSLVRVPVLLDPAAGHYGPPTNPVRFNVEFPGLSGDPVCVAYEPLRIARAQAAEMTVTPRPIVKRIDIDSHLGGRQLAVLVNLLLDPGSVPPLVEIENGVTSC